MCYKTSEVSTLLSSNLEVACIGREEIHVCREAPRPENFCRRVQYKRTDDPCLTEPCDLEGHADILRREGLKYVSATWVTSDFPQP